MGLGVQLGWAYLIVGEMVAIIIIGHPVFLQMWDATRGRRWEPYAVTIMMVIAWPVATVWLLSQDSTDDY
jgi:hypothetical protein